MKIDESKLNIVYVPKMKLLDQSEKFYAVPNASNYALSNFGRLVYHFEENGVEHWNNIKPVIDTIDEISTAPDIKESYPILYDGEKLPQIVKIRKLIASVLFPNGNDVVLFYTADPTDPKRWQFDKLKKIKTHEEQIKEAEENRDTKLFDVAEKIDIKNQIEFPNKSFYKYITSRYFSMRARTTNKKVKAKYPQYADAKLCDEWRYNKTSFGEWYVQNIYYYPDGKLELDKDLLSFSESQFYSPELCCILPCKYNVMFKRQPAPLGFSIRQKKLKSGDVVYILPGHAFNLPDEKLKAYTSSSYADVLNKARQRKANYIRGLVKIEREAGYIPEKILKVMEQWASLCEMGLSVWEPTRENLIKMDVI